MIKTESRRFTATFRVDETKHCMKDNAQPLFHRSQLTKASKTKLLRWLQSVLFKVLCHLGASAKTSELPKFVDSNFKPPTSIPTLSLSLSLSLYFSSLSSSFHRLAVVSLALCSSSLLMHHLLCATPNIQSNGGLQVTPKLSCFQKTTNAMLMPLRLANAR